MGRNRQSAYGRQINRKGEGTATLESALGKKAMLQYLPDQPGDMAITHADISRAHQLIGYSPRTSLQSGIEKFAAWFKESRQTR
jgi:UDP-glucuronate 4-epimerase